MWMYGAQPLLNTQVALGCWMTGRPPYFPASDAGIATWVQILFDIFFRSHNIGFISSPSVSDSAGDVLRCWMLHRRADLVVFFAAPLPLTAEDDVVYMAFYMPSSPWWPGTKKLFIVLRDFSSWRVRNRATAGPGFAAASSPRGVHVFMLRVVQKRKGLSRAVA